MIFVTYTKIENERIVYDYTFFSDWAELFKWLFSFTINHNEQLNVIICEDKINKITYSIDKVIDDEGVHFEKFRHCSGEFLKALKESIQFHK